MTEQKSLFEKLWLGVPIAVWFSFNPLIRLGANETMNFELSVSLLYSLLLALTGIPIIWQSRHKLLKNKIVWLVSLFFVWHGLSLFWTGNHIRGALVLGVIGILYLIFLASISKASEIYSLMPRLVSIAVVAAVVMSFFSYIQFFAGIWLAPSATLLCLGCEVTQFGFVRPNAFTIEPQFFGNLLLAPALLLLWRLLEKGYRHTTALGFVLLVSAICLTLSRGSIFAFAIGAFVLFALQIRNIRRIAYSILLTVFAFVFCLSMQGLAAELSPKYNENFTTAVTKSVNHLSLGIIDLRSTANNKEMATTGGAPVFDGYIEESSEVRVGLSVSALKIWRQDLSNVVLGVGIGGAGIALHENFPDRFIRREIVQNEYVKTLFEVGLVGFVLFVAMIATLFYGLRNSRWVWAIVIAIVVQWNFFSGYPNALHVHLLFIILTVFALRSRLTVSDK